MLHVSLWERCTTFSTFCKCHGIRYALFQIIGVNFAHFDRLRNWNVLLLHHTAGNRRSERCFQERPPAARAPFKQDRTDSWAAAAAGSVDRRAAAEKEGNRSAFHHIILALHSTRKNKLNREQWTTQRGSATGGVSVWYSLQLSSKSEKLGRRIRETGQGSLIIGAL